jgi:hypothetical protein
MIDEFVMHREAFSVNRWSVWSSSVHSPAVGAKDTFAHCLQPILVPPF